MPDRFIASASLMVAEQGKANNAKAQAAADALQDNLRVLREELDRASKSN